MKCICLDNSCGFVDRLTINKVYDINFITTRHDYNKTPGDDGNVVDDNGVVITFHRPLYFGRFMKFEIGYYRDIQIDKVLNT